MDWRLFSAVTLAGVSFSMVAFGAYTLRAADAVPRDAGRSSPPLAAPSLTALNVSGAAVIVTPDRGVSFVPVTPSAATPDAATPNATSGDAVAARATERLAQPGTQMAAVEETSPVLVADLPITQDNKVTRSPWLHRHHVTWKVGHHVRFCTALRPCGTDRKSTQVAVKHSEERAAPKVALMLGVGF
jgi:hypothetical protein